jgi:hypothetical protein
LWNRAAKWADDSPLFGASVIEIVLRLALPKTGCVMVVASSWSEASCRGRWKLLVLLTESALAVATVSIDEN